MTYHTAINIPNEYTYETSKLQYLYPYNEIENLSCDVRHFINKEVEYDKDRMSKMLSIIDGAIREHATHRELTEIVQCIDREFHVSDSEWARMQLKIIEFTYPPIVKFDYMQNNWHLYLQIEIANWLVAKELG